MTIDFKNGTMLFEGLTRNLVIYNSKLKKVTIKLTRKPTPDTLYTTPTSKRYRSERTQNDLDRLFIESTTKQKARELNYSYIDLYGFPIDNAHLVLIPLAYVLKYNIGVFSKNNNDIYVVSTDFDVPGQDKIINDFVKQGLVVKKYIGSSLSMSKLIANFDHVVSRTEISDDISIGESKINTLRDKVKDLTNLSTVISQTSMSDFMEIVLIAAIENKASDIHFEPEKLDYHLRLRLDGILYTFATLPSELKNKIESRIKILSGLKINVDNVPQDGRFSFKYSGKDIDVRVSMLPSNYGYSVVMRLLGTGDITLSFESLGFTGKAREKIEWAINKPQGLILTTGPTGSGKTTTLYTILSTLNDGGNKIVTLEDPIEYKLAGISQTQINSESGYTFAGGLRSILRQDPDIVMVGEVRDGETADVAIQASLTGHQVLSTIHTNDAAGALPRLIEMGARGFILADAISVIIGQRLVRKICPHCKTTETITDNKILNVIKSNLISLPKDVKASLPADLFFYKSTGCSKCNNTGFKGRVGVYEVLTMTDTIRELISSSEPSIVQVRNAAAADGMLTMFQDGLLKAINGETSIEEIFRILQV